MALLITINIRSSLFPMIKYNSTIHFFEIEKSDEHFFNIAEPAEMLIAPFNKKNQDG
jgi:hypothetical protein